jgi:PIN domain nuclease of toxin-antitoxin system
VAPCKSIQNDLAKRFLKDLEDAEAQTENPPPIGKLTLSKPLSVILQQEQATNDFRLLPVTMAHVYALDGFPLHHRDPFGRLLVAQAYQEELTLVTHDPKLSAYSVPLL